jgi:hypothetical protein
MKVFSLIVALALSSPAFAEPVTLSLAEAEEVLTGFAELSKGHTIVVKDAPVTVSYKGWTLPVIMAMTKDINALRPTVVPYQEAKQRRLGEMAPGERQAFFKEDDAARSEKTTYELTLFKLSDLKPDVNEIPLVTLSALRTLLVPE